MPLISESIASLLGGVSQQPALSRDPSQGESQVNGLSDKARGLMKRPPTEHAGYISTSPALWPSTFSHVISRDLKERYRVFITDGDLKVFDARTNQILPVEFLNGKSYLNIVGEADAAFRAVTVGDSTYIINRNIPVEASTAKSDPAVNQALIVVTQADFGTNYNVTIDAVSVNYSTPAGTSAEVRNVISTEIVASNIAQEILKLIPTGFSVTRYGNAVSIIPTNAQPFVISVDDGLADNAIRLIKNSTQRFTDLPDKAPEGYVVEIIGDPSNAFDNYWVKYTNGAWIECPRPGELVALSPATMPHALVRGGSHLDRVISSGGPVLPRVGLAESSDWNATIWLQSRDGLASALMTGPSGQKVHQVSRTSPDTYFNCALSDGSDLEVLVDFESVATTAFRNAETLTFTIQYWDGATWVDCANPEATVTYRAGLVRSNQTLRGIVPGAYAAAGADIKLNETHTAPTPNGALAFLRAPRYRNAGHIAVQFDPTAYYPGGVQLTLTLEGTNVFNYTPTYDETGVDVALAFVPLVDAHASYSAISGGEGIVEISGLASVTDVVPSAAWSTALNCHLPTASMVGGTLVGTTIRNLSDGSEGIVTANGATTLTVASMAGGNDNLFTSGDTISVEGDSTTFVFRQVDWAERKTGSLTLTPWPSFVGRTINEVFYTRGRLGLCAGDSVVLSEAGEPTNFFRTTVAQLIDSDPIDARSTAPQGAVWHSAVNLDEALFLFTERDQFILAGDPALTPKTIRIELVTSFESVPNLRPLVSGRRLFFPLSHRGSSQVMEYEAASTRQGTFYDGELITKHVPKYVLGTVRQMAVSPELGLLFVIADDTTNPTAMIYGAAYLTAGDIPDAPEPDGTLLDGYGDYLPFTETEAVLDASAATPDAFEDEDTLGLADAVAESGAAHPDKTLGESLSMTESETVSDYDTAGPPEITASGVYSYYNYGPGEAPKHLNRPGSVKFTFTETHAESVKVEFRDYADTPVLTDIIDTDVAGDTYISTLFDSSIGETTYKAVITPYSGNSATGTAGTPVTVITLTMRTFI